jgi:predicted dehydrogenase
MHIDSQGYSSIWPDAAGRTPENLLRKHNWITTIPLSGDMIVEYSIHTIDAVLWTVGKRPVKACGHARRCRPDPKGDSRDLYMVMYEFDDGLVWTHRCQALHNIHDNHIRAEISGETAHAVIGFTGRAFLRGGKQQFGGGQVFSLYNQGPMRNIAAFYQSIISGDCSNPTVQRAVDDALTGILGREAAARGAQLTMDELIRENKALEFDTRGLKA